MMYYRAQFCFVKISRKPVWELQNFSNKWSCYRDTRQALSKVLRMVHATQYKESKNYFVDPFIGTDMVILIPVRLFLWNGSISCSGHKNHWLGQLANSYHPFSILGSATHPRQWNRRPRSTRCSSHSNRILSRKSRNALGRFEDFQDKVLRKRRLSPDTMLCPQWTTGVSRAHRNKARRINVIIFQQWKNLYLFLTSVTPALPMLSQAS